jgi:hypothetical protein
MYKCVSRFVMDDKDEFGMDPFSPFNSKALVEGLWAYSEGLPEGDDAKATKEEIETHVFFMLMLSTAGESQQLFQSRKRWLPSQLRPPGARVTDDSAGAAGAEGRARIKSRQDELKLAV